MTQPVANEVYVVANGTVSTTLSITYLATRNPTAQDLQFPIQKRWINTTTGQEFFLLNFSSLGGTVTANWIQITGGTAILTTLKANSGGFVSPTAGNINVVGDATTINIIGNQGSSTLTANVILPASPHQILLGETSSIAGLGVATNGQIPIGSTGADPILNTITAGSGITVTNGAGSITIASTAGSSVVETLTGNTGGPISPVSNNINTLGTGSITIVGSGSTLTTQLTGLTNHSLLVGAGSATITNLGVATNGQLPIGSTGANPVLSTLTAGAGISITNGAGSITIASIEGATAFNEIVIQEFTTSGTYTPTSGMQYCIIECIGGGGAGGGVSSALGGVGTGGGGGSGSYSRKISTTAAIGASQTVTIGAGGTGVSGDTGNNGSDTSLGTICVGKGGSGGSFGTGGGPGGGGDGGVSGTGDFTPFGDGGTNGMYANITTVFLIGGEGGVSVYGGGGIGGAGSTNASNAGGNASNYGSGGGGASANNSNASAAGGNGSAGIVLVTEYIST